MFYVEAQCLLEMTPRTELEKILGITPAEIFECVLSDSRLRCKQEGLYECLELSDASVAYDCLPTSSLLKSASRPCISYDLALVYDFDVVNNCMTAERMSFKNTLPHAKLFYPEPFIASPSYLHSDLIFLNILQY